MLCTVLHLSKIPLGAAWANSFPGFKNTPKIRQNLLPQQQSLHIVQPETLLRWHRELFRLYWRQKSQGKPKVSPETIRLIQKIAKENHLWGTERIRGELLKLGIEVSKRSIQKYMPKEMRSRSSSQTWATFLKNQAGTMWACDFTVVYDWLFRQWYIFVVMELKKRRIVHTCATKF